MVDGVHVAPLTVARTHREKGRGLLGSSGIDGALWLEGTSSVHMMGMQYAIDVAVLDDKGRVLLLATLAPWTGLTRPRRRGRVTVEAEAGSWLRWGVGQASVLSIG